MVPDHLIRMHSIQMLVLRHRCPPTQDLTPAAGAQTALHTRTHLIESLAQTKRWKGNQLEDRTYCDGQVQGKADKHSDQPTIYM